MYKQIYTALIWWHDGFSPLKIPHSKSISWGKKSTIGYTMVLFIQYCCHNALGTMYFVIGFPHQCYCVTHAYLVNCLCICMQRWVCFCIHTIEERENAWDIMHNTCEVELTRYLYNWEDYTFVDIWLGGPCLYITDLDCHINFLGDLYLYMFFVYWICFCMYRSHISHCII